MHAAADTYDFVALGLLAWVCFMALAASFTYGYERGKSQLPLGRAFRHCARCRAERLATAQARLQSAQEAGASSVREVPHARR